MVICALLVSALRIYTRRISCIFLLLGIKLFTEYVSAYKYLKMPRGIENVPILSIINVLNIAKISDLLSRILQNN